MIFGIWSEVKLAIIKEYASAYMMIFFMLSAGTISAV